MTRLREAPGPDPLWGESWYVDFADGDRRGGFLRLTILPNAGAAWLWAAFVDGETLVVVRDHEIPVPRGESLEVRAGGLWVDLVCETPMVHWTYGLEAFGLGLDDPLDMLGAERGDRVPLGFDFEWEAAEPPFTAGPPAGRPHHGHREHAGRVHGDVLVGSERVAVDGWGHREERFGVHDWWGIGWRWASARLVSSGPGSAGAADDVTFSVVHPDRPGAEHASGYVARQGEDPHPVTFAEISTEWDDHGLPLRAAYVVDGDLVVDAEVVAPVALRVPAPDGSGEARVVRALCRYEARAGDGAATYSGAGWAEWSFPPERAG